MWKSCVYKLTINNETYVGSTCNLKNRLKQHKSDYYNTNSDNHNAKIYKYIRENSEWDNVKVEILVHLHPKFNRRDREHFEQEWIDYLKPTLNGCKATTGLTKKEYIKQYAIENKSKVDEHKKKYQNNNKEKRKEQFNCECGGHYTYTHKSRHLKTKGHLEFIESKKTSLPNLPTEIIDKINVMAREMEILEMKELNRAVSFNTCMKWIDYTMEDRNETGWDEDHFNFFEFLQEIEFLV